MIHVLGHLETRWAEPPMTPALRVGESEVLKGSRRVFAGHGILGAGLEGKDNGPSKWNVV